MVHAKHRAVAHRVRFGFPRKAGDKSAGLPICTAKPPEGRAPWMARVHLPRRGRRGQLFILMLIFGRRGNRPSRAAPSGSSTPLVCATSLWRTLRAATLQTSAVLPKFPRFAGEGTADASVHGDSCSYRSVSLSSDWLTLISPRSASTNSLLVAAATPCCNVVRAASRVFTSRPAVAPSVTRSSCTSA